MILAIIQARLGSTRFPRKVLADLGGQTVISRVYDRAKQIPGVDLVVVAWPVPDIPEEDVLGRFKWYADWHKPDTIVRITGDCPLLDPQVGGLVLKKYLEGGWDYVSNVWPKRTWPDGQDVEIFSRKALDETNEKAVSKPDREHVCTWMHFNLKCGSVELPIDWSGIRMTLDYPEDLEFMRKALVYQEFYRSI